MNRTELIKHINKHGFIPKDNSCPFLKTKKYIGGCGKWFCTHEVNNKAKDYSCGMARGFAIANKGN